MTYNIKEIEGIGPAYGAKLADAGVHTTDDLLRMAGDAAGRKALSEQTGFEEKTLLEWANRADLMRVSGIAEEYADLLEYSGVDTVKELATRNAENLVEKMEEVNKEKKLVRKTPSLSEVEKWIEESGTMEPMISH